MDLTKEGSNSIGGIALRLFRWCEGFRGIRPISRNWTVEKLSGGKHGA